VAILAYGMPSEMAGKAALLGGLSGLLPIGWIVLNIIFLQQLAEQNGSFKILQDSLSGITEDRRLQLLLIAFCFGAFFEGAAGFGTPVALTAGILIGLGFSPLAASGLSLMGGVGVAMTGSETASNVLFGGMQKVAAEQLGLSPNLMGAANSSGGVMGKMIDAQSIVVASTATRWFNHEGDILRYVFFHSIALACLVGLYVTLQAYVWPFTLMVVH
jgi:L-lactate permease